nr:MAG TPA: hypothetical protein [Caudoviricetes sp.]
MSKGEDNPPHKHFIFLITYFYSPQKKCRTSIGKLLNLNLNNF